MDDGGKLDYNKDSQNKSIVLNTQSFTEIEVEKMSKELSNKFKLICMCRGTEIRSNKGKKVIVISAVSYPIFRNLIDPYI
jgi:hypothetical protein